MDFQKPTRILDCIPAGPQLNRKAKIQREEIFKLEETNVVLEWYNFAERLPNLSGNGKGKHAFTRVAIEAVKSEKKTDKDCLSRIIDKWTDISGNHTVGPLYDLLHEMGFGADADRIFGHDAQATGQRQTHTQSQWCLVAGSFLRNIILFLPFSRQWQSL